MKTRSLDLNCGKKMHSRFAITLNKKMKNYQDRQNTMSINKRLKNLNYIFLYSLQHMNMFIRLLNINYMKSVEFYFKQILDKKKFFKKEIAQYSLDPNNNNPQFKLYSKLLFNKILKVTNKLTN